VLGWVMVRLYSLDARAVLAYTKRVVPSMCPHEDMGKNVARSREVESSPQGSRERPGLCRSRFRPTQDHSAGG